MDFVYSFLITTGCFAFNILIFLLLQALTPVSAQTSEREKMHINIIVIISICLLGFLCYLNPDLMSFLSLIILICELLGLLLIFLLH